MKAVPVPFNRMFAWVIILALPVFLTSCAETQLAIHAAKKVGQDQNLTADKRKINATRVRRASLRPYTIRGVRYVPRDDPDYDETGLASWYGNPFHGRATATGEIFDMNQVSAAHKTLPLPATVEVTNLENGRVMTVRVNDRGPFVHGRIIDLSRRAAQLLGFEKQGVARVRVRLTPSARDSFVMRPAKTSTAEKKAVKAAPRNQVAVTTLPAPSGTGDQTSLNQSVPKVSKPVIRSSTPPRVGEVVAGAPAASQKLFVQAGSFSSYQNALRLRAQLSTLGPVEIKHAFIDDTDYFRVHLGPLDNVTHADNMLAQVMASGAEEARIVVD